MSVNKFASINYQLRKYKSLNINTKTLTSRLYQNYNDDFPSFNNIVFGGDFQDNGFDVDKRGTYFGNVCKVDMLFTGIQISGTSGEGTIEVALTSVGNSISPTVSTEYLVGIGRYVIDGSETYNVSTVNTVFVGNEWKLLITFTASRTPTLSSNTGFGNLTLFYNIAA